jgi:hypothetical protein
MVALFLHSGINQNSYLFSQYSEHQKCKDSGLEHYEKGYPGGAACGLVLRDHTELENQGLISVL